MIAELKTLAEHLDGEVDRVAWVGGWSQNKADLLVDPSLMLDDEPYDAYFGLYRLQGGEPVLVGWLLVSGIAGLIATQTIGHTAEHIAEEVAGEDPDGSVSEERLAAQATVRRYLSDVTIAA